MSKDDESRALVRKMKDLLDDDMDKLKVPEGMAFVKALNELYAGAAALVVDYMVQEAQNDPKFASHFTRYKVALRDVIREKRPLQTRAALLCFMADPASIRLSYAHSYANYPCTLAELERKLARGENPLEESTNEEAARAILASVRRRHAALAPGGAGAAAVTTDDAAASNAAPAAKTAAAAGAAKMSDQESRALVRRLKDVLDEDEDKLKVPEGVAFVKALHELYPGAAAHTVDTLVQEARNDPSVSKNFSRYKLAIRELIKAQHPLQTCAAFLCFMADGGSIRLAYCYDATDYQCTIAELEGKLARGSAPVQGSTDDEAISRAILASVRRRQAGGAPAAATPAAPGAGAGAGAATGGAGAGAAPVAAAPAVPVVANPIPAGDPWPQGLKAHQAAQARAARQRALLAREPLPYEQLAPLRPLAYEALPPAATMAAIQAAKAGGYPSLPAAVPGYEGAAWMTLAEANAHAGFNLGQRFGQVSIIIAPGAGAACAYPMCDFMDLNPADPNRRVRFEAAAAYKVSADKAHACIGCLRCGSAWQLEHPDFGARTLAAGWAARLQPGDPGLPERVPGFEGQPWTSRAFCEALYPFTVAGNRLLPGNDVCGPAECRWENKICRPKVSDQDEFRIGYASTSAYAYKISADGRRACMTCVCCGETYELLPNPAERAERGVLPLWPDSTSLEPPGFISPWLPWGDADRYTQPHKDEARGENVHRGDPNCEHRHKVCIYPCRQHIQSMDNAYEGCPRCGWVQRTNYWVSYFNDY